MMPFLKAAGGAAVKGVKGIQKGRKKLKASRKKFNLGTAEKFTQSLLKGKKDAGS